LALLPFVSLPALEAWPFLAASAVVTEITAYRLDRLTVNEIRATDLSNRLHDQHSNLGSHENGSQRGPLSAGVPIGC
jgi:hypothetical protein